MAQPVLLGHSSRTVHQNGISLLLCTLAGVWSVLCNPVCPVSQLWTAGSQANPVTWMRGT